MVRVEALSHRFDTPWILRDINLQAEPGQIVAIMGSSGGGKTTLLRCISGLITPTMGSVVVDGVPVKDKPDDARKRMGMVFQTAALFDFMSVRENVLFGMERQIKADSGKLLELANQALQRVGLTMEDSLKMPSDLSGGMKKRAGIARALALNPKVMLYDEPTTGLDPITAYTIDSLMVSLRNERKMTCLLVSHDVSSVLRVADRVLFLHAGMMVFDGTPGEFEVTREPSIRELVDKSRATNLELSI